MSAVQPGGSCAVGKSAIAPALRAQVAAAPPSGPPLTQAIKRVSGAPLQKSSRLRAARAKQLVIALHETSPLAEHSAPVASSGTSVPPSFPGTPTSPPEGELIIPSINGPASVTSLGCSCSCGHPSSVNIRMRGETRGPDFHRMPDGFANIGPKLYRESPCLSSVTDGQLITTSLRHLSSFEDRLVANPSALSQETRPGWTSFSEGAQIAPARGQFAQHT
jgi:hypothetical protein